MTTPNKQESNQLDSLHRQLARLAESTHRLNARMVINGRDNRYCSVTREVSVEIGKLAKRVESLLNGADPDNQPRGEGPR